MVILKYEKKNNTLENEFTLKNGSESYDILEIRKNEVSHWVEILSIFMI